MKTRTGGKFYSLYIDARLFAILKRSAEAKRVSINTLITQELAFLYADKEEEKVAQTA